MNTSEFFAVLTIGMSLGLTAGAGLVGYSVNNQWQYDSIQHHAAHYDATTGEFTWNDEVKEAGK